MRALRFLQFMSMLILTPLWIVLTAVMAFLDVDWTWKLIGDKAERAGYHRHV